MKSKDGENRVSGIWYLRHAHREMLEWRMIGLSLVVLGAAVLTVAVVGPFGIEGSMSSAQRLGFIALCGVCCWPIAHALSAAILYVARGRSPPEILLACAVGALFVAVPCSAILFSALTLYRPQLAALVPLSDVYLNVFVPVFACGCFVHYVACQRAKLRHVVETQTRRLPPAPGDSSETLVPVTVATPPDAREKLFERLPEMVGRDIVYVSVSGHYIKVNTTEGSSLLLMRLSDAVGALGDMGLQVHRSYWVAHRHITGVLRRDGRMLLRLTGAQEVPVSRTHMAAVRNAVSTKRGSQGQPAHEAPAE